MKYFYFFTFFLVISSVSFGQNSTFSQHKYIIVDSTFDFLKQVDRYKTSSFTKFLFNKAGFKAYLDTEELPKDFLENKCNALYATIKDNSGMFISKNFIELKDCNEKLVFSSNKGTSKLKDYERAYRESIRKAFATIPNLHFIYTSAIVNLVKPHKKKSPSIQETITVIPVSDIPANVKVEQPIVSTKKDLVNESKKLEYPLLYAQEINGTYQLINNTTSVLFLLLKTTDKTKFIIKDQNGVLFNKGTYWLAEYYKNGVLTIEKYQIKF